MSIFNHKRHRNTAFLTTRMDKASVPCPYRSIEAASINLNLHQPPTLITLFLLQHPSERRSLRQQNNRSDGEDQLGEHVGTVVGDGIDKRRTPAIGHPDIKNQGTRNKVRAEAAEQRQRNTEDHADPTTGTEQTCKTDDGECGNVVENETADQRGRCQTPRDDLAKVEKQLNHGIQKAARQTPVQSETDGQNTDGKHRQQCDRAAERCFVQLDHRQNGCKRDHDRTFDHRAQIGAFFGV